MTPEHFDKMLNERLKKIQRVLRSKGHEYGTDDRLHNFKRAAQKRGCTPIEALMGMKVKHEVSVDDMINGHLPITQETIDEKIGDNINYFILLEALMTEIIMLKGE